MLTSADIQARVRQLPFLPFRVITSAGEHYDVRHPDLIMVGRRDLVVGLARQSESSIYDQLARLSILHVTALEDPPVPGPAVGTNGAG